MESHKIKIYTDGACSGNPGPGGWWSIIICNEVTKEIFGGERNTTNNRMELKSVIEALKIVNPHDHIQIYTDSKYVKDGITSWIHNWKKNGWKTASKKLVKNVDLWTELDSLCDKIKIDWIWIKGHSGNAGNERADTLAREAIPK